MVGLSLLPIGIAQAWPASRRASGTRVRPSSCSSRWIEQLRWLRIVGDTVFLVGVGAFAWFMSGLWFGWSYEPAGAPETRQAALPCPVPTQ